MLNSVWFPFVKCLLSVVSAEVESWQLLQPCFFSTELNIAIVAEGREGTWFRLIHEKTGIRQYDRWFWNEGPQSKGLNDKVDWLKDNHLWLEVRETYLTKKNLYLSRGDRNHPSFNCYIEAVNEVFHKYR